MADVEALLESIEPRQFDWWRAFAVVDGWDDDWLKTAVIAAAAANAGKLAAAATAGVELEKISWAKPEDFLPSAERQAEPATQILSASQSKRLAAMRFGR